MNAVVVFSDNRRSWLESPSLGAGPTASVLKKKLAEVKLHVQERATDWEQPIIVALQEIAQSCSVPNWDGQGAQSITKHTLAIAYELAMLLSRQVSPGISPPDPIPEPDGEISLSWDLGPEMVFSVSVGESKQLNYAGIIGHGTERHGGEPFNSSTNKPLKAITAVVEELFEHYRAQSPRRT